MMTRFLPLAGFVLLAILLGVGLKIADKKTEIPSFQGKQISILTEVALRLYLSQHLV